ncbi:MAG: hypothetical protein R2849_17570 [Thermomicrobiales bacterium]
MSEEPASIPVSFDDRYLQQFRSRCCLTAAPIPGLNQSSTEQPPPRSANEAAFELSGVSKHITTLTPRLASRDEISASTPGYVARVERPSAWRFRRRGQERRSGRGPSTSRAWRQAALTVDAVNGAILGESSPSSALPAITAPSPISEWASHLQQRRSGGAARPRSPRPPNRIVIVDWDVHHGNGTQDAFYDDDSVLFFSIHQDRLFPSTSGWLEQDGHGDGKGYTINIPLPPGSGDAAYLTAFDEIILPITDDFVPKLTSCRPPMPDHGPAWPHVRRRITAGSRL